MRSISFVFTIAPLLLIFPEGQLLSHRWRIVVWLFLVGTALNVADVLFEPESYGTRLLLPPRSSGVQVPTTVVDLVSAIMYVVMMLTVAAAVVAVVIRFRQSRGDERQQIKWLASAASFMALAFLIAPVIWSSPALNDSPAWTILFFLALALIPLSIGIAVLKYRLYDIDIIIRRTLIYGALTAALAFLYFGSVVLLQGSLRALTGQTSDLAIVASILIIAALFAPLRSGIQELIDRRLYRRRYDAAQVDVWHDGAR